MGKLQNYVMVGHVERRFGIIFVDEIIQYEYRQFPRTGDGRAAERTSVAREIADRLAACDTAEAEGVRTVFSRLRNVRC